MRRARPIWKGWTALQPGVLLLRTRPPKGGFGTEAKLDPIRAISDGGTMNGGHYALISRELVPIDIVFFVRVNREGDVWVLPGFAEFGGLGNR